MTSRQLRYRLVWIVAAIVVVLSLTACANFRVGFTEEFCIGEAACTKKCEDKKP